MVRCKVLYRPHQVRHFRPYLVPNITTMRSLADNLTDAWRLCDQSVCNSLMQNFLIRGASQEQRWVCLDIATIKPAGVATTSKEIWQIDLVDYDAGEVLIDEYLKHSCLSGCHCERMLHQSPDIDPEALGKLFQAKGISQCNILVWCKNFFDMRHTRAFLAKAGLEAALPADKQCLLILNQVEVNTTSFPKLRTIYPAVFPGDQLIQQHHDAVADVKMLRRLVAKLELAWDCGLKGTEMRKALQHQLRQQNTLDNFVGFKG